MQQDVSSHWFRPATQEDLVTVATWINSPRDCEFWAGKAVVYPLQLSTLGADIGLSPRSSFCLDQHQIVAFGQLLDKGHGRAHLAKIIVNPELRGQGIGKRLIENLLSKAREELFSVLGLNVNPENHIAINMYKGSGFDFVERPPTVTASPGSLYMELTL